jgi:hypothetical protein
MASAAKWRNWRQAGERRQQHQRRKISISQKYRREKKKKRKAASISKGGEAVAARPRRKTSKNVKNVKTFWQPFSDVSVTCWPSMVTAA